MEKPIVLVVVDKKGNPFIRASGDVLVAWVHPDITYDDRVLEVMRREPRETLVRYLGPPQTWGSTEDERQTEVKARIGASGLLDGWGDYVDLLFADPE